MIMDMIMGLGLVCFAIHRIFMMNVMPGGQSLKAHICRPTTTRMMMIIATIAETTGSKGRGCKREIQPSDGQSVRARRTTPS